MNHLITTIEKFTVDSALLATVMDTAITEEAISNLKARGLHPFGYHWQAVYDEYQKIHTKRFGAPMHISLINGKPERR